MVVEVLTQRDVVEGLVRRLGLDPELLDLESPEVLAAVIRRTASFSCPTTAGRLVTSVLDPLKGLAREGLREAVTGIVDDLVSIGDLLELPVVDELTDRTHRQLFLGPPTFVRRQSNACLLIGIRPEGADLLGDEFSPRIEIEAHSRLVRFNEADDPSAILVAQGLRELAQADWLEHPSEITARDLLANLDTRVDASRELADLGDVSILDSTRDVTYYRGRWRSVTPGDSGRFVGRRQQAYGADIWCYCQIEGGQIVRILDLPIDGPLARGCDEAWRLQAAIDSLSGKEQIVQVTNGREPRTLLTFFSPVPTWIQRRLEIVGTPVVQAGGLMSYRIGHEEVGEELSFLSAMMWTTARTQDER